MVAQGGTPRIITFWIASEESEELDLSVTTSKNVWAPESFLQQSVGYGLQEGQGFGEKGAQTCNSLIFGGR